MSQVSDANSFARSPALIDSRKIVTMALRFRERGKKGRRQRQEHTFKRAKAINTSWHRRTDTVLETARLCADAEQKLVLQTRISFSKNWISTKQLSVSLQVKSI